ncbi:GMC oxidoreductase-domain-containing protein [Apiospora marii]|uniref:GMC oxidoreductase-domain-containing protein n=1 Tax=Apiospora marii TaxID=335849 RepID=A0ABR1R010_9PEZI
MVIYNELPSTLKEVDVIIAGGGTTACVVASRLAAADPGLSVLVIESGRDNYGVPAVTHPLLWRENYKQDEQQRVYHHVARPENQLADRESVVTVGHTLGGGSSVNLMMYMRAQKCDFDSWGTPGWTSDELRPFIKKWETYHGLGNPDDHGYDGPVQVSSGTYRSEVAEDDFIQAMKQLGYDEPPDLQDFHSIGVSRIMKYISPDGRRQDAAHTYLHPLLQGGKHPNLHVLVETQVVRVLFDGDRRASGVEFRPNPATQPSSSAETSSNKTTTRSVAAKKLVVLSCGTLGSPPILERSGVGDPAVLERASGGSVPLVAALPGVGHDFQDHTISLYPYQADLPPDSTADGVHDGSEEGIAALLASGDKRLGWNGIDASSKLRPTAAEVKALGPSFGAVWDRDFRDEPGKPLVSMLFHAGSLVHQAAEADAGEEQRVIGGRAKTAVSSQYFTIDVFSSYPYSRGHVHITGNSLDDPLDFKTGYLSDEAEFDLKTHVWGYKKQREVARRMKSQRGELALRVPSFAAGSVAAFPAVGEEVDATKAENEIQYEALDKVVIEKWLRDNMSTCWHGLGTCKMAPQEAMGVVDADLGVHGVRGLKVADLSIVPENVAVNTMSTALTVGEKAADIFIRELGLSGAANV